MYFDSSLAAKRSELTRMNEVAAAAAGLGPETRVRCFTCDRAETVDGAHAMRFGWPRCCGATMRLIPDLPGPASGRPRLLSDFPAGSSHAGTAAAFVPPGSGGPLSVANAGDEAPADRPVVAVEAAIGGGGQRSLPSLSRVPRSTPLASRED